MSLILPKKIPFDIKKNFRYTQFIYLNEHKCVHYINLCENVLKRCDNIRSQSRPLLFQFPSRTALLLRIKHINGKNCDNLWVNCVLISTDFSTLHGNKFENAKCFEQFVEPETAKSAPTTYVILTQYYLFSGFHEIRQKLMTSTG